MGLVYLSFARGVDLAFFGWLFVGPECGVWFVVDGVVVGAFPSVWGGRLSFFPGFGGACPAGLGIWYLLFRADALS